MATRAAVKTPAKVETLAPTLVSPPDVVAIQKKLAEMGDINVSVNIMSDEAAFEASAMASKLQTYIEWVEEQFQQSTSLAFKLHRSLTSLRGSLIARPQAVVADIKRGIVAWDAKKQREAEAARQAEIKRLAEDRRRQEEEAKRLAEEAAMEKAPWEQGDDPAAGAPVAPVIPIAAPVHVPASAPATPIMGNFRRKPYRAQVDLKALVIACAKRLEHGDEKLLPYLLVNESLLNAKAREVGEEIGVVLDPCITAVRERTVAI